MPNYRAMYYELSRANKEMLELSFQLSAVAAVAQQKCEEIYAATEDTPLTLVGGDRDDDPD